MTKHTHEQLRVKGAAFNVGGRGELATTGVGQWFYKFNGHYYGPYRRKHEALKALEEEQDDRT